MQRGFIQIPIFVAILIGIAALGGTGYVAYEVTKPSASNPDLSTTVTSSVEATTTLNTEVVTGEPAGKNDPLIGLLKKQVADLTQKINTPKIEAQNTTVESETTIVTLPSGATVEMDPNGNIIRTIKEAPQKTYPAPTQTTQNINIEESSYSTQSQPTPPRPAPKYQIEYQTFSQGYVNNQYVNTLKYRLRSSSDNAPDIVKIVTRIYAVAATQEFAGALDTWFRSNGFGAFNDKSNLEYLGAARIIVPEGGANVFKDVLIFEKRYYSVSIPARNVSQELSFSINQGGMFPGGYIVKMYLESTSIDSTDENIYKIE